MAIKVERSPHVVVTDEASGWSLRGGRSAADRTTTKRMTHSNGATCTLYLGPIDRDANETKIAIRGMLYLNPGEDKGTYLRKEPLPGDFVGRDELYAIASALCVAWHEATYKNVAPIRIILPT